MAGSSLLEAVTAYQAKPLDQQNPEELRALMARSAAAGAVALVPAAAPLAVPATVPASAARATAHAAILGAVIAYMEKKRALDDEQLRHVLVAQAKARGETALDVAPLLVDEQERGKQFAAAQRARLDAALPQILAMPEGQARADAMQALMDREQRYEEQRSAAMFGRAVGGLNALVLRAQSPQGAWWKLSPFVKEHTAGCLAMGERFWPWVILDRLRPPRHPGCPCHLEGYMAAVSNGWMKPGDVPSVEEARRLSAGVVMEALEGQVYELEMRVAPLREALVRAGMVDVLAFDRAAGVL